MHFGRVIKSVQVLIPCDEEEEFMPPNDIKVAPFEVVFLISFRVIHIGQFTTSLRCLIYEIYFDILHVL